MNGILVAMMVMNCTFDSSGSEAMCSIACASFYAAALLGDSGAWSLLIYGSCVGGALVTGIADGRATLREYCARILRWRVGLKWYAIALALPLLLGLLALAANLAAAALLLVAFTGRQLGRKFSSRAGVVPKTQDEEIKLLTPKQGNGPPASIY